MRFAFASFTLIAFLACGLPAVAAQDSIPSSNWQKDTPKVHIERGLSQMAKGDYEGGFQTLFGKSHKKEILEKLKFEVYRLAKRSGSPNGYEMVFQQQAGTTVTRYRYLLLFDIQPIMFDFYYYKTKRGWKLRHIQYSLDFKKFFIR